MVILQRFEFCVEHNYVLDRFALPFCAENYITNEKRKEKCASMWNLAYFFLPILQAYLLTQCISALNNIDDAKDYLGLT